MAGFFNPNAGFDANNPNDYDYQSQAQKLQMMQALAQRMGQPLDQGKMVGGWYAGPSKGATIASALQQALAGVMQVKDMQNEQNLNKADREAMLSARKAYNDANDPMGYLEKAKEQFPVPEAQYSYKEGVMVGPPDPRRAAPIVEEAAPPMNDLAAPMQTVSVVGKRETPFDVAQPHPEDVNAARTNQGRHLQKSMAADREAAIERLSRTKSGGPLAQALMARDNAPTEWVKGTTENGDGSKADYFYNKANPNQRMDGPAGVGGLSPYQQQQLALEREKMLVDSANKGRDADYKERDLGLRVAEKQTDNSRNDDKLLLDINEKRAQTQADLAATQSGIGTIEKAMGLVGKWNARGGPLSEARLKAGLLLGENDAVEVNRTLQAVAALNMKSIFGAAPSDSERAAFQKVIGDAAAGKTVALSGLNNLYERSKANEAAHKEADKRYAEQAARYTPTPAAQAPAGRPGGYGKSVGSPADILNSRF